MEFLGYRICKFLTSLILLGCFATWLYSFSSTSNIKIYLTPYPHQFMILAAFKFFFSNFMGINIILYMTIRLSLLIAFCFDLVWVGFTFVSYKLDCYYCYRNCMFICFVPFLCVGARFPWPLALMLVTCQFAHHRNSTTVQVESASIIT